MKRLTILILILSGLICGANAQNPFEKYGYTPKIATLSKGKYNEFFDNDSIVQIGSVLFNTRSNQIVAFIETDTTYSEATLQPDIVSRWLSTDPAVMSYPSISPYVYTLNNPIRFVDIQGKWVAEIKDGVVIFKAEVGDNISTLETQLGLPQNAILKDIALSDKTVLDNPNVGDIIKLQNLEVVQNINGYLSRTDIAETNCSNCAMEVNGLPQENAWANKGTGGEQMTQAQELLDTKFKNIPASESKIGDVVTFSENGWEQSADLEMRLRYNYLVKSGLLNAEAISKDEFVKQEMDKISANKQPDHYGVVILKDKTGKDVQQFLEKSGTTPVKISTEGSDTFIPRGNRNDKSNVYQKSN
jgi:hypothetical protein